VDFVCTYIYHFTLTQHNIVVESAKTKQYNNKHV